MGICSFRSAKLEVRPAQVGGIGAFAKENIYRDEICWIRAGHIVQTEEAVQLDRQIGDFSVQIGDDFFLCPRSPEEVADLVIHFNHSCDPNVGLDGQITYVAMRDICAGEELCVDYALMTSASYFLECRCGSPLCRKVITGNDWRLPNLWSRYGDYFSSYLLKKIAKLSHEKCMPQ